MEEMLLIVPQGTKCLPNHRILDPDRLEEVSEKVGRMIVSQVSKARNALKQVQLEYNAAVEKRSAAIQQAKVCRELVYFCRFPLLIPVRMRLLTRR
jgi:hypothetical protein